MSEAADWTRIYLDALRLDMRERVGEFAASRSRYELWHEHDPPMRTHWFTTEVLAKTTGPRTYEAHESATAMMVGFASWFDHFKATYRGRWWMRWRRWRIHYRQRSETKTATVRVEAELALFFPHAAALPIFPEWLGQGYAVILRTERTYPEDPKPRIVG
jgi:hypothetical protein